MLSLKVGSQCKVGGKVRARSRQEVRQRTITLGAAALLAASMVGTASAAEGQTPSVPAAGSPPDIVVLYLDDVDPHDGRLWNDERRTPTLARLFAEQGVAFSQAISETPLCSPGRANTLTGQHTVHTGVARNVTVPFDPSTTLGTELQAVGYTTMFVGKYLNAFRSEVPRREVRDYAAGWDAFDVIYEDNGKYLDYDLWTRDGMVSYGKDPADHSTLVAKRRVTKHLRDAPTDAPAFAFVSLFDLHEPNRPADTYRGARRCRSIEPWDPPSFDEDVSDKPAYVQARPAIKSDGWPMETYCEQMLAVDELAEAVVREQKQRGRLDDTLFVLTADNGVTWGTHRLPQRKGNPYATPIPLVLTWPARWGEEPRTVHELVSNTDLAPTLCAIAGCEMGPFSDGQELADGMNLLPLLDGEVEHLERTVVREQSGPGYPWSPEFWAIRTSSQHPLGRWHYIEYVTGEVELYESEVDPWELDNLAGDPATADVEGQLAAELRVEFPDLP
jgi:arylsulfatase A-like enzyme